MARPLRYEAVGAVYHVMARGDGGREIFESDQDRLDWVDRIERACGRFGWQVHAYVLMGNHFHLLLETPEPKSVTGDGARAHDEAEAERLVVAGLEHLGLPPDSEDQAGRGRFRDEKALVAWWTRQRTAATNGWLGERLAMGHPGSVRREVGRVARDPELARRAKKMAKVLG
ncbi:hypothetical protein HNR46_002825 [Haloferula luteola]|uniref:Transposase IS200-like domain-containing protein n=1 Tax=Haloferula luteola TaxID=595692 RepID=A0A840VFI4_9BACT|nr:transposase [Haloferula luteola]MBB5352579.1 hypothetical protein [Haloferula luteola]